MSAPEGGCSANVSGLVFHRSTMLGGVELAVPELEAVLTLLVLGAIIVLTIVGNVLVILSVFTHKPLRIVQNFFIVSLAVADLTVAVLVLPLNVAYSLLGRWHLGITVCKMWLTSDVLCCTASILNLCAIALDRYWAITDPINYACKRTLRRVLVMIGGVWLMSLLISSPPLAGWNDWPHPNEFNSSTPCQLTSEKGYVIYSSLGSFFIPLLIMTLVYAEIFVATRRRLRERANASKLNAVLSSHPAAAAVTPQLPKDAPAPPVPTKDPESSGENQANGERRKRRRRKRGSVERARRSNTAASSTDDISAIGVDGDSGVVPIVAPAVAPPTRKNTVHQFVEERQRISLSKERRAARTLGIIMGVFVVCWLPFFLMYVILPFCTSCCPSDKLISFVTWLGYLNSALNPIIYTIFNLDFRRAFKKLLRLKSLKC
ncbi:Hypothetical predicted protein [Cloeon dipterum]|uniref:G-protein coupled receptors family 1 profile domain-containing protein n=1 Tax=Cloeon dipterum TaxID=197152 RepID=A0A8S1CD22_9INSE|nr:Hypothetical predicted protein [Cloeon dipterum]